MNYSKNPKINFIKCKAITYDRVYNQDMLDKMYLESEYYYDDTGEDGKITFYGTKRFAEHLYKCCCPTKKSGVLYILDFGGGDGKIRYEFAKMLIKKALMKK